jgi:hypothetical protein
MKMTHMYTLLRPLIEGSRFTLPVEGEHL